MLEPANYADILRALGQWLDGEGAQGVDLVVTDSALVLSWQTPSGASERRTYEATDVNTLRIRARDFRDGLATLPLGERAELRRTIGQNLETQGIRLDRLAEITGGYRVTGSANGNYISQWYTIESLRSLSQERRGQRSAPLPLPGPSVPWDRTQSRRSRGIER